MSNHPRFILPVRDVSKQLDRKVNLLGVVVEFSIPHRSEGTDYCTILKIVDASQHTPELCVNVFTENICDSPHIWSYQDFIFLSNVWVPSCRICLENIVTSDQKQKQIEAEDSICVQGLLVYLWETFAGSKVPCKID